MDDDKRVYVNVPLEDFTFLCGVYERSLVLKAMMEVDTLSKKEITAIMFERK